MAAFHADNAETGLCEDSYQFWILDTRRSAHAAIVKRWIPTNSNFLFRRAFDCQAPHDNFADSLGDLVERAGLCVAIRDLRNRGSVIAL